MTPELKEYTAAAILSELSGAQQRSDAADLANASIAAHRGLVRAFVSPHEVVATWGGGARVFIDSAVVVPEQVVEPLVAELTRQAQRHLVVCSVSTSDTIIGLDGVARKGVDGLVHTLSNVLPLGPAEECLVIALPDDSPAVRVLAVAHHEGAGLSPIEITPQQRGQLCVGLGPSIDRLQALHSEAYHRRAATEEIAARAEEWRRCGDELTQRAAAATERYQTLLSGPMPLASAAELERLERLQREFQLLALVADQTAARESLREQDQGSKSESGKRRSAMLRRARLSRPLGARALERSRRSDDRRKRFTAEELTQAFSALEADFAERLGQVQRGALALDRAVAEAGREMSWFENGPEDAERSRTLGALIEREVQYEQTRLAQARQVGRADPRVALQVVEETRERLSLLRQLVELAEWIDSEQEDESADEAIRLATLEQASDSAAAELQGLEPPLLAVLEAENMQQLRGALRNFAAAYRMYSEDVG